MRNEKILNLHELGYIHRGVPYQTLNLIEYNTETPETISAYTNTNGDTLYNTSNNFADLSNGGDRSILDYVSLGSGIEITGSLEETTPNKGRINPSTYHRAVLKMLFSNISSDHPDASDNTTRVGESGTAISESDITSLISNFPGISSRTDRTYHDGTNKIFPSLGYFDPIWFKNLKNNPPSYGIPFKLTTDLNDREAEVLLCNTRRFVSVSRNYYMASLIVRDATAADPVSRLSYGTETKKIQYIVRELIDDAKDNQDPSRTPHTVFDDKYRARVMR